MEKTKIIIEKIKNKFAYKNVPDADLEKILSYSAYKTFNKNNFIFMEGEDIDNYYFIYSGKVEIFKFTNKTNKRLICILNDGDDIGAPQLLHTLNFPNNKFNINAQCLTKCTIACIPKEKFLNKIIKIQSYAQALLGMLAYIIDEAYLEFSTLSSENKLASYLCYIYKNSRFKENNKEFIPRQLSDEKISEILNITRETVNRLLKKFEKMQIIELSKDKIKIINIDILNEISNKGDSFIGFYGTI